MVDGRRLLTSRAEAPTCVRITSCTLSMRRHASDCIWAEYYHPTSGVCMPVLLPRSAAGLTHLKQRVVMRLSSRGLGRRPVTAVTRVRISLGALEQQSSPWSL